MNVAKAAELIERYIKTLFTEDCIVSLKSINMDTSKRADECTCKIEVIADHIIDMELTIKISSLKLLTLASNG